MAKRQLHINNVIIEYDKTLITIKKSYNISYHHIVEFCYLLRDRLPFRYKRSVHSWIEEVEAHNFMYELGLFQDRTRDTDIDDNEKWYRLVAYRFLYLAYKFYKHFI